MVLPANICVTSRETTQPFETLFSVTTTKINLGCSTLFEKTISFPLVILISQSSLNIVTNIPLQDFFVHLSNPEKGWSSTWKMSAHFSGKVRFKLEFRFHSNWTRVFRYEFEVCSLII